MSSSRVTLILGLGLIVLAAIGLARVGGVFPVWAVGVIGLLAVLIGFRRRISFWNIPVQVAAPTAFCLLLFGAWLLDLAVRAPAWLSWFTFLGSFAFFILAISAAANRERAWVGPPENSTENKKTDSERPQEVA